MHRRNCDVCGIGGGFARYLARSQNTCGDRRNLGSYFEHREKLQNSQSFARCCGVAGGALVEDELRDVLGIVVSRYKRGFIPPPH